MLPVIVEPNYDPDGWILNQIEDINQVNLTEFPFEESMENIFLNLRFNTGRNPSKSDYEIRQKIENSRRMRSINSVHGRHNNNESFTSQSSENSVFNRTENSSQNSTKSPVETVSELLSTDNDTENSSLSPNDNKSRHENLKV